MEVNGIKALKQLNTTETRIMLQAL